MSRRLPKHRASERDRAEADSGIKRQIRPAGSVRAEAGRKSGGCGGTAGRRTGCFQDAVQALTALGYSGTEALQAVKKVEITEGMDSEAVLKAALKHMF